MKSKLSPKSMSNSKSLSLVASIICLLVFQTFPFSTARAQEVGAGATANIQINLNQAKVKKSLVAFPNLQFTGVAAANPSFATVMSDLSRVIQNDLTVSTYFKFLAPEAFLEDTAKTAIKPFSATEPTGFKFESWKQIGAEFLIRGALGLSGDQLTLEIYSYNTHTGNLVFGKKYKSVKSAARKIAHTFSNDFMEAVTGTKGPFNSKITFSSDRAGGQFKEIYVSDYDGANVDKITSHKSIAISPAISPDGSRVAYTAFVQRAKTKSRNADLFIYEITTGKRWLVSYRQGLNSGASFTGDGKQLLMTMSQGGSPDIFRINFEGDIINKITNGPRGTMNVEPVLSPDGSKIAFSSDRSGQPMIYVMNANGSSPQRMTFAGKYNSSPSWSPDGKKIAFAGYDDEHFDVFVMNSDGSNIVRVTSSRKPNGKWANNEDPTFSPDGRMLMYTSNRTGTNQIFLSNLDGSEERQITNDRFNYFKPKWSNNID